MGNRPFSLNDWAGSVWLQPTIAQKLGQNGPKWWWWFDLGLGRVPSLGWPIMRWQLIAAPTLSKFSSSLAEDPDHLWSSATQSIGKSFCIGKEEQQCQIYRAAKSTKQPERVHYFEIMHAALPSCKPFHVSTKKVDITEASEGAPGWLEDPSAQRSSYSSKLALWAVQSLCLLSHFIQGTAKTDRTKGTLY